MQRPSWFLVSLLVTACDTGAPLDDGLVASVIVAPRLDDKADLKALPIVIGERAFNELYNDGYLASVSLPWTAARVLVTSEGQISASIEAEFNGPKVADATSFRDALFWNVTGTQALGSFGDSTTFDWSPVRGVPATTSTPTSASFDLEGTFEVPPIEQRQARATRLEGVELRLTWIRAWTTPQGVRYQVLAGASPEGPESLATFDIASQSPRGGRFMYYAPRPVGSASSGFDYKSWFESH